MTKIELLANKIQEMLGNKYAIFPIYHFRKNYTEAKQVIENGNVGYAVYTNSQYGDFRKNKIVGILQIENPSRSNVNFYHLTGSYKIEFSVPRNIWKTNKNGQLIEPIPFDFQNEIETFANSVINSTITVSSSLRCKMTMGEALYITTETDGEFEYDIMRVSGQIVLTSGAKFGSDYTVEFKVGSTGDGYVALDDIISYSESNDVNSNAIQKQGKMKTEQNPVQSGWVATVQIDDITTTNLARTFIYGVIHNNTEEINPTGTSKKLKREIPVRITSPHGQTHSFNAIMSIDFRSTSNGTGTYVVTLTDDGG